MSKANKPLGGKNYGSIPHLPGSRMGPADHHCHPGQEAICTVKARDKHDLIIVTEKVDGSNVGIARIGDDIVALGRSGYLAQTSPFEQHQLFAAWVRNDEDRWRKALQPGERVVGEWLAQAHATRYSLPGGPFVAFDRFHEGKRVQEWATDFLPWCLVRHIPTPKVLHRGEPISVAEAMSRHGDGAHGLLDEPEGVVYRVERKGVFDFLAKYVRPEKVDGYLLPEISGKDPVWNWRPV